MCFELNEPTASDVSKKEILKLVSICSLKSGQSMDPDMLDMLVDMFQCRNLEGCCGMGR